MTKDESVQMRSARLATQHLPPSEEGLAPLLSSLSNKTPAFPRLNIHDVLSPAFEIVMEKGAFAVLCKVMNTGQ